jgi:hypothetical protein
MYLLTSEVSLAAFDLFFCPKTCKYDDDPDAREETMA